MERPVWAEAMALLMHGLPDLRSIWRAEFTFACILGKQMMRGYPVQWLKELLYGLYRIISKTKNKPSGVLISGWFILRYPVLVVIPNIQFGKNGKSKLCGNSAHGMIFVLNISGKEIDMPVFFNISDKPAQCIFSLYLTGTCFSVDGTLIGRVKQN